MDPSRAGPPAHRTSRLLSGLVPELRELCVELLIACVERGIAVELSSGRRTLQEQARLYARGREKPGRRVTGAPPGRSNHNSGRAFDVVVRRENGSTDWSFASYERVWEVAVEVGLDRRGLRWGGTFPSRDGPHFEIADSGTSREADDG